MMTPAMMILFCNRRRVMLDRILRAFVMLSSAPCNVFLLCRIVSRWECRSRRMLTPTSCGTHAKAAQAQAVEMAACQLRYFSQLLCMAIQEGSFKC